MLPAASASGLSELPAFVMPVQVLGAAATSVVDVFTMGTIDRVTSPYADDHVRHGIRNSSTKTAQFTYMLDNMLIINAHKLVEAAGVELLHIQ